MRTRDYLQKLESLNNELDIILEKQKEISKRIQEMHNMIECPRCYQIFTHAEMNGQLCKGCVEFLEKENIK